MPTPEARVKLIETLLPNNTVVKNFPYEKYGILLNVRFICICRTILDPILN